MLSTEKRIKTGNFATSSVVISCFRLTILLPVIEHFRSTGRAGQRDKRVTGSGDVYDDDRHVIKTADCVSGRAMTLRPHHFR